jgi:hypothetical protein
MKGSAMKIVQQGDRGIEIKLSVKNIEQLLSVVESGEWGMKLTKFIPTEDDTFVLVVGVESDERHYNEEGVAE